ncbi:hypothetical protein BUE93_20455 [Chromobacterium amazonense]|uniref:Uncharacterized protein n=1 Tax=Chromobacterium amazonense TaxID=1382803 RepID=A0A2S9WZC9_9NEIS|nr:hypothetical protein [Chromobacterium amazonense]PRP68821.1 hypothetical protein BUE93_20455 [Chromobacterium amazonense]
MNKIANGLFYGAMAFVGLWVILIGVLSITMGNRFERGLNTPLEDAYMLGFPLKYINEFHDQPNPARAKSAISSIRSMGAYLKWVQQDYPEFVDQLPKLNGKGELSATKQSVLAVTLNRIDALPWAKILSDFSEKNPGNDYCKRGIYTDCLKYSKDQALSDLDVARLDAALREYQIYEFINRLVANVATKSIHATLPKEFNEFYGMSIFAGERDSQEWMGFKISNMMIAVGSLLLAILAGMAGYAIIKKQTWRQQYKACFTVVLSIAVLTIPVMIQLRNGLLVFI